MPNPKSSRSKTARRGNASTRKKAGAKKSTTGAIKTTGTKKSTAGRGSRKRDLVRTPTGSFFAHRDGQGQFTELDEVGRSLSADRRQKAKTKVKSGYGDRGDR